jgi:hypothetical protein
MTDSSTQNWSGFLHGLPPGSRFSLPEKQNYRRLQINRIDRIIRIYRIKFKFFKIFGRISLETASSPLVITDCI